MVVNFNQIQVWKLCFGHCSRNVMQIKVIIFFNRVLEKKNVLALFSYTEETQMRVGCESTVCPYKRPVLPLILPMWLFFSYLLCLGCRGLRNRLNFFCVLVEECMCFLPLCNTVYWINSGSHPDLNFCSCNSIVPVPVKGDFHPVLLCVTANLRVTKKIRLL